MVCLDKYLQTPAFLMTGKIILKRIWVVCSCKRLVKEVTWDEKRLQDNATYSEIEERERERIWYQQFGEQVACLEEKAKGKGKKKKKVLVARYKKVSEKGVRMEKKLVCYHLYKAYYCFLLYYYCCYLYKHPWPQCNWQDKDLCHLGDIWCFNATRTKFA